MDSMRTQLSQAGALGLVAFVLLFVLIGSGNEVRSGSNASSSPSVLKPEQLRVADSVRIGDTEYRYQE